VQEGKLLHSLAKCPFGRAVIDSAKAWECTTRRTLQLHADLGRFADELGMAGEDTRSDLVTAVDALDHFVNYCNIDIEDMHVEFLKRDASGAVQSAIRSMVRKSLIGIQEGKLQKVSCHSDCPPPAWAAMFWTLVSF
jgi:hypothetical protein